MYLYICSVLNNVVDLCLGWSSSVKVFRCQLPRDNPLYSREPPKKDDKPSVPGGRYEFLPHFLSF